MTDIESKWQPTVSVTFFDSRALVIHITSKYDDAITDGIIQSLVTPWIEGEIINSLVDLTRENETNVDRYFSGVVRANKRLRDEKGKHKNPDEIPLLACLITNHQLDYLSVQCMLGTNRTNNITIIVLSRKPLTQNQERPLRNNVNVTVNF